MSLILSNFYEGSMFSEKERFVWLGKTVLSTKTDIVFFIHDNLTIAFKEKRLH